MVGEAVGSKEQRKAKKCASIGELTVLYTNCCSLIKKRNELSQLICDLKPQPSVISLTETWTNDTISNDELNILGYVLRGRRDRTDTKGGRGGGILVYVKEHITASQVKVDICEKFNEAVCVKIETLVHHLLIPQLLTRKQ